VNLETDNSPVFREHARAWLSLTPVGDPRQPRIVTAGGRRVVIAETVSAVDGLSLREVLLVRGDFHCGAGCRFLAPVYVGGTATVGRRSRLESICTAGDLTLGLDAHVERWADARGRLDLRAGAWVRKAVSDVSIHVSNRAGGSLFYAPEIASQAALRTIAEPATAADYIEIPVPASGREPELGAARGFRREKLQPLGAETWVYDGSLHLTAAVLLRAKLVVRGSFTCPAGSLIEDDIKAGATMRLGAGTIARGNLTTRGEMVLEEGCLFEGSLKAGLSLTLKSGVRGFKNGSPVKVQAREQIALEPDVIVRGRIESGTRVLADQPVLEGGMDLLLAEI
jgi:hypothetical protein